MAVCRQGGQVELGSAVSLLKYILNPAIIRPTPCPDRRDGGWREVGVGEELGIMNL